jgi:hemerythrin
LKYYATSYVRASAEKKLTALIGMRPEEFGSYFEVHDLVAGQWNLVEGLEVKPVYSPHPVETTVLFFRAARKGESGTYAHLADIIDFSTLKRMTGGDPAAASITPTFYNSYTSALLSPVDVKKIDAGGGLIHGTAEDFRKDASRIKYLSHKTGALAAKEKEIGASAPFGSQDVLVAAREDLHTGPAAVRFLSECFPEVSKREISRLAACSTVPFKAGATIMRAGNTSDALYMILDGVADSESKDGPACLLTSGSLINEMSALTGETTRRTYRARSHVTALRIPRDLYESFVGNNGIRHSLQQLREVRRFLQSTWLFGEMVSFPVANKIARSIARKTASAGQCVHVTEESGLAILEKGRVLLSTGSNRYESLGPGGFWGETSVLQDAPDLFEATAERDCSYFLIPARALRDIPIVRWKLVETFRGRLAWFRTHAKLEWTKGYALGARTDGRQKRLFNVVRDLADCMERPGKSRMCSELTSEVEREGSKLFALQESVMKKRRFPGLKHHKQEHEKMLAQIRRLDDEKSLLAETNHASVRDFLKDWMLTHTVLEDAKLKAFLAGGK